MVRNHQDGYPYINLSLFILYILKIYRNINFCGKIDWSMNSGPQWAGDCKGYQKKLFPFSKLDKKW